jgi:membrane associated rhomboid family serine protease
VISLSPKADRPGIDSPITLAIALAAIAVTAAALSGGPDGAVARALAADADRVAAGGAHRLVTGPFLHVTWGHLVRDLALVAIPGIAYEAVLGRRWVVLVALGLVAPAAAVLASGVPAYYGLSGLSHAVLAAVLVFELRHRRGAARGYVAVLLAAGAAKCIYELVAGAAAFPMDLGAGVVQVPLAHAVGAAVGIGVALTASASGTR